MTKQSISFEVSTSDLPALPENRGIAARNALNAALHGHGTVIDDLETAVHLACLAIRRDAEKNAEIARLRAETVRLTGAPTAKQVWSHTEECLHAALAVSQAEAALREALLELVAAAENGRSLREPCNSARAALAASVPQATAGEPLTDEEILGHAANLSTGIWAESPDEDGYEFSQASLLEFARAITARGIGEK